MKSKVGTMQKRNNEQFDDQPTRRLAEALRAALEADTPEPSAQLRAAVLQKLSHTEDQAMADGKTLGKSADDSIPTPAKRSDGKAGGRATFWWTIGVSACLLIAAGTVGWFASQMQEQQHKERHVAFANASPQPHREDVAADETFPLDKGRVVTTKEGTVLILDGQEYPVPDEAFLSPSESTVQLPNVAQATEDFSSSPAVPDGGTVQLGEIEKLRSEQWLASPPPHSAGTQGMPTAGTITGQHGRARPGYRPSSAAAGLRPGQAPADPRGLSAGDAEGRHVTRTPIYGPAEVPLAAGDGRSVIRKPSYGSSPGQITGGEGLAPERYFRSPTQGSGTAGGISSSGGASRPGESNSPQAGTRFESVGLDIGGAPQLGEGGKRGLVRHAQEVLETRIDPATGQRLVIDGGSGAEEYAPIHENAFQPVTGETAVSTFSIDVDTASYSNVRRFLTGGALPPPDAVRIEELVNYFHYDYPQPKGDAPFSASMELAGCPWNEKHQLLRVALKGKEIEAAQRPASNLVFLLDVSGSMQSPDKLPLLKEAIKMLVGELRKDDRVAIVTYAGNAGLVLDGVRGDQPIKIRGAIDALNAGGSTNGSAGIQLAYEKAIEGYIDGGTNRVILATDGDLNVGVTNDDDLVDLIKDKAASGVFLSVLGLGTGNLKDTKLEKLADNGNGNYAYLDNLKEARKVLVEQVAGSLVTIAKDVKLQLEFNPAEVRAYRLIGYENRMLAREDFDNDKKDAGEIGAGHTVTALYELVPAGSDEQIPGLDGPAEKPQPLKYQQLAVGAAGADKPDAEAQQQKPPKLTEAAGSGELLTLALRYKQPEASESTRLEFTLPAKASSFNRASKDFQFAAAVASFGMLLRRSQYRGSANYAAVEEIAGGAVGADPQGRRQEFVDLVRRAEQLSR